MRELSIEGGPMRVAHGFYNALSAFHPEVAGDDNGDYRVTVEVGNSRRLIAVLDEVQAHVTERNNGSARVELDGHRYTFHSRDRVAVALKAELCADGG